MVLFLLIRAFDWLDDRRGGKRLTKLPARQFIDTALTYIQKQLQDESLFPTKFGRLAGSFISHVICRVAYFLYTYIVHVHVGHLPHCTYNRWK